MKKLKNVLIINDFPFIQGGASDVAINTANLLSNKYNVYFFTSTKSKVDLNSSVKIVSTNQQESLRDTNRIRGLLNNIYNVKAKKNLTEVLSSLSQDDTIVHVHGWTKSLSSSIFDVLFQKNFKVILTLHDYFISCPNGGYFNYKKNEICSLKAMSLKCIKCNCDSRNYIFKFVRVVRQFVQNNIVKLPEKIKYCISISKLSEKILKENINGGAKIYRIYNPINMSKNEKKSDYRKNDYFLYVGRVSLEKGVEIFCKAISDVKFKGIVVGDGPELDSLKAKYPSIKFVGWQTKNMVQKYMQNAKCLIFPSLWYETAGLTVLEAQKLGIPALVTSTSAAAEFVDSDFTFNGVEELKSKLINFNEMDYVPLKQDKYNNEVYLEKIEKAYLEILNNGD